MLVLQSLFGLIAMLGIAILLSEDRRRIAWRPVAAGVALQLVLALVMVKLPLSQSLFAGLNQVVLVLDKATTAGTSFVFGYLGGDALPFEVSDPSKTFVLAFQALPLVIVVSALSALLFYWRVLPWVVTQLARLLTRSMGIGGALGLGAAANIFVGMIEAPLFIRPYLAKLSRSELFALMTTGMATIAGTMMVLYASILSEVREDALGQILSASVISIPAALVIALVLVPGNGEQSVAAAELESEATSEEFLDYFRTVVQVGYDSASSIFTLKTRAYSPKMARDLGQAILAQSEQLVNQLAERSLKDSLVLARSELAVAEERVTKARESMKRFRNQKELLNPEAVAGSMLALVAELEEALTAAHPDAAIKVWKFMLGRGGGKKIEAAFSGPDPDVLRRLADIGYAAVPFDPDAAEGSLKQTRARPDFCLFTLAYYFGHISTEAAGAFC